MSGPAPDSPGKPTLTTGQLAALFGVNRSTVIRWLEAGRFGAQGEGWYLTAGGPQRQQYRVYAEAARNLFSAKQLHSARQRRSITSPAPAGSDEGDSQ